MTEAPTKITLSFSASPVSTKYNETVEAISKLYIDNKSIVDQYNQYRKQVDTLKEELISFCSSHNVEIDDNVEQEAIAAAPLVQQSYSNKDPETTRLNANAKYTLLKSLLTDIDSIAGNDKQKDGSILFTALRDAFIKTVEKEYGTTAKIQSPKYFEVPCYADKELLLMDEDKDDWKSITKKNPDGSNGRKLVYLNVKQILKRMENPLKNQQD